MIKYTFTNCTHEPTILCLVDDFVNVHSYIRKEGEKKYDDLGRTTRVIIDGFSSKEFEWLGLDIVELDGKITKAHLLSNGEGDTKKIGWYHEQIALDVSGMRLSITKVTTPHSANKSKTQKRKKFYPEPPPDMTPGELHEKEFAFITCI